MKIRSFQPPWFYDFFRNDDKLNELSTDDRIEIFSKLY